MTHVARANVYWPSIDADIADYAKRCTMCAKQKASQTVQPMLPCDIPDRPWQELATDYFTHQGKDYLLIADSFSKYPFIYKIPSKTSDSIIQCLQGLFPQYGTPQHFFSDNRPLFSSDLFQNFSHHMALTTLHPHPYTQSPMALLSGKSKS